MKANGCIACSVAECRHHADNENYCTLEKIQVAKCDSKSCCSADTECGSFEAK